MKQLIIKGMLLLGCTLFVAGAVQIYPHILFDNHIDYINLHLKSFMWCLVLICAGLAILQSYIAHRVAKVWIMSIIFTIIALSMVFIMERNLIQQSIQSQKVSVIEKSSLIQRQIEGSIMADLSLARTMISKIQATDFTIEQDEFAEHAQYILESSPTIRHIALAKNLIVSHVYPIEGNERAIGLNYRSNPQQLPMVRKALDENKVILAGPVNLVQGGTALIARIPIPLNENPESIDDFWGIMSIIIDSEKLFAGLNNNSSPLVISIRGKDALGAKGGIVFGQESTFDMQPMLSTIVLPYGNWQVATTPIYGWAESSPYKVELRIAIFLIWLMMIIFTLVRAGNEKKFDDSIDTLQSKLDDSKQRSKEQEKENKAQVQAQKLEALGQLTGGIAHDFNNILAAITGYAELSQMSLRTGVNENKLSTNLKEIIKAGNRAKALVSQMLTFSRGKDVKAEVIEPITVLQETLQMMHSILPTSIKLETNYTDFESRIKIDPVQLQQVLINLVVNARDAIPHAQGKITIGCELLSDYHGLCISCNDTFDGDYLCISISDNGQGITQEQLTKIFDPFFTTKAVGKGTGMGLSVVHGILHGVNGHIIIESKLNLGSSIKLLFSVTDEPLPKSNVHANMKPMPPLENVDSTMRVMVIDDEEPITQLYEDVFEAEGIDTIIFNSPELALDYFKQHQSDIAVIVTDYTMPGLNGTDFIRAIRRQNNQVPVILCSGNADVLDRGIFEEIGVNHFLAKPVNLMEMSRLVSGYL